MTEPARWPATQAAIGLELVLPHATWLATLAPAGTPQGALWHGRLVLQATGSTVQALVGPLVPGAPGQAPAQRAAGLARQGLPTALALLWHAPASAAHPLDGQGWERWLGRTAPAFRLACSSLVPDVAAVWHWPDGRFAAALRQGDAWGLLHGQGHRQSHAQLTWQAVQRLLLPGAGMAAHLLTEAPASRAPQPAAPGQPPAAGAAPATGRYSRLAGALGAQRLLRLQQCCFGLVGSGPLGSMLGHSLARMGASLMVLDARAMDDAALAGDLPPGHQGRPRPLALQQQLRGLLRPGARFDPRALGAASPAAGHLLAGVDVVLCCSQDTAMRDAAGAWALALHKPLLAVATRVALAGAEAQLHLLPPATGCLRCRAMRWLVPAAPLAPPGPGQRSWHGMAAHAALRLLEQMFTGQQAGARVRRLLDLGASGSATGLQVHDLPDTAAPAGPCPWCQALAGAGLAAASAMLHGA